MKQKYLFSSSSSLCFSFFNGSKTSILINPRKKEMTALDNLFDSLNITIEYLLITCSWVLFFMSDRFFSQEDSSISPQDWWLILAVISTSCVGLIAHLINTNYSSTLGPYFMFAYIVILFSWTIVGGDLWFRSALECVQEGDTGAIFGVICWCSMVVQLCIIIFHYRVSEKVCVGNCLRTKSSAQNKACDFL